MSMGAVIGLK